VARRCPSARERSGAGQTSGEGEPWRGGTGPPARVGGAAWPSGEVAMEEKRWREPQRGKHRGAAGGAT
jgi:hypothetical protein